MDRRGMFGSRKPSKVDADERDRVDAAEVRANRAEARAELAERRLQDADEIAEQRVSAAAKTLLEVREVIGVLAAQVEGASGELASIVSRFEAETRAKADTGTAPTDSDEEPELEEPTDRSTGDDKEEPDSEPEEDSAVAAQAPAGSPLQRATRMAMAGKSRERIARTLSEEYGVEDPTPILEEAMGHQEG